MKELYHQPFLFGQTQDGLSQMNKHFRVIWFHRTGHVFILQGFVLPAVPDTATENIRGLTAGDPREPGLKAFGTSQTAEILQYNEENLLQHIFGSVIIADSVEGNSPHQRGKTVVQLLQRGPMALYGFPYGLVQMLVHDVS
jgi:hypothetical protein